MNIICIDQKIVSMYGRNSINRMYTSLACSVWKRNYKRQSLWHFPRKECNRHAYFVGIHCSKIETIMEKIQGMDSGVCHLLQAKSAILEFLFRKLHWVLLPNQIVWNYWWLPCQQKMVKLLPKSNHNDYPSVKKVTKKKTLVQNPFTAVYRLPL